jgi:hypothetical protein
MGVAPDGTTLDGKLGLMREDIVAPSGNVGGGALSP